MLNQVIYWNAPLWQLIVGLLILISAFGFQHWLIRRKPTIREAITDTDANLADLPLFFFTELRGLIPLNDGAYKFVEQSREKKDSDVNLLMLTLKNAQHSNQVIVEHGLSDANLSLITIPNSVESEQAGVLAVLANDVSLQEANDHLLESVVTSKEPLHEWIQIDKNLMMHLLMRKIQVQRGDSWVEESPTYLQYEMLRYFVNNVGQPLSYDEIFKHAWIDEEVESFGLTNSQREKLRTQVYQLRQLIEQNPSKPEKINTIRNYGYTFQAQIVNAEVSDE